MAATTRVRDFIWRVSNALNDASSQYVGWAETDIVNAINDGQLAICKLVPTACARLDALQLRASSFQTISSIPSTACKPADGSTPPTAIAGRQVMSVECNMTVSGTAEGRAVRLVSRSDMDLQDPDWRSRVGTSVEVYMIDDNQPDIFYISPRPADATQWLRVSYAAAPQAVPAGNDTTPVYANGGSSTTLLGIDDFNVDDLFWYVLARLNIKDTAVAKPAIMQTAVSLFVGSLNAQVQAQTGVNPKIKGLPDVAGGG